MIGPGRHALGAIRNELGIVAVLLVVHVYREEHNGEEIIRIISARAAEKHELRRYKEQKMTDREGRAVRRIAAEQAAGDDSRVNLKVIPRLTDRQLAAMVRLREVRPRKKAVSVRLDERVLAWLKSKGRGHLTLINDILANMMEAEKRAGRSR
jgi:uncharacterized protein (DUF4415 family)